MLVSWQTNACIMADSCYKEVQSGKIGHNFGEIAMTYGWLVGWFRQQSISATSHHNQGKEKLQST